MNIENQIFEKRNQRSKEKSKIKREIKDQKRNQRSKEKQRGDKKECKRQEQTKTEKPDIRKMFRYTAKKVLWLLNYSLSFSKRDTGKEIGIKVLGCFLILQSISVLFFVSFSLLEIILINPFFTLGLFILTGVFVFKKEIKELFHSKKLKTKIREEI